MALMTLSQTISEVRKLAGKVANGIVCLKWEDGSSMQGYTNLVHDQSQVIIAEDVLEDDAAFYVACADLPWSEIEQAVKFWEEKNG